jgi:glycine/D-amino acid oxidase-like deaminating enzyme
VFVVENFKQCFLAFGFSCFNMIVVLGKGIIGLTAALELQTAGHNTLIMHKPADAHFTSLKAGAFWRSFAETAKQQGGPL